MKRVTIYLPEGLYEELKEMKRKGKIRSISEFLRNLIVYAMRLPRGIYRRITVEEWRPITRNKEEEEREVKVGYGAHHHEIMSQLKAVLARRMRNAGRN